MTNHLLIIALFVINTRSVIEVIEPLSLKNKIRNKENKTG
jgi:hypothetical protein